MNHQPALPLLQVRALTPPPRRHGACSSWMEILFTRGDLPMTIHMERVEDRILSIRGHRVMVDTDLAEVYGVPTKRLNER